MSDEEVLSYIRQVRQYIESSAERGGEGLVPRPHFFVEGEYVSPHDGLSAALHFLVMAERHLVDNREVSLVILGASIGLAFSQGVTPSLYNQFGGLEVMRPANERAT